MKRRYFVGMLALLVAGCSLPNEKSTDSAAGQDAGEASLPVEGGEIMGDNIGADDIVVRTEAEWRALLTPEEFNVLREKGTEQAFSGDLYTLRDDGTYVCAACGNPLFSSDTKYDSGTGWPSFWAPLNDRSVVEEEDNSWLGTRTEVLCRRCGGHLGHVFADGPKPTGLRYCMNSVAMDFEPDKE